MVILFNIWWSGALLSALICLYENYRFTSRISIEKVDVALILSSWITVVLWVCLNLSER